FTDHLQVVLGLEQLAKSAAHDLVVVEEEHTDRHSRILPERAYHPRVSGGHLGAQAGPRQLRRLLDAVLLIGSQLDLAEVLQSIAEVATELVDATYGALGVLDDTGARLTQFLTVGIDEDRRRA